MSAHPADTARPGDAFRDENAVTWMKIDAPDVSPPWLTSRRVNGTRWYTTAEARERTLTPLVPEGSERSAMSTLHQMLGAPGSVVDAVAKLIDRDAGYFSEPDASDPVQLRHAVAILNKLVNNPGPLVMAHVIDVAHELSRRADRLDVDVADRKLAEQIAEEKHHSPGLWDDLHEAVRESRIQTALAGIRAGRDAQRGVS